MRAGAIALLLLAGCAREIPARPALYVLRDADTTIWLFGTIHFLPKNVRWETPAVTRAIADSQALVGELPGGADVDASAEQFARMSRASGLPPLVARVPAAARAKLKQAVRACGVPLDRVKSWAAALWLSGCGAATAGADARAGVESVLARRFAGRPRLGLETLEGQLALFDRLDEADQRRLLIASLDSAQEYRRLLAAWTSGDTARLGQLLAAPFADAPTLRAVLIDRRNIRWSRWIGARMGQPGRLFLAVGAGHLAGPGSVIDRLRAAGYKVERVS